MSRFIYPFAPGTLLDNVVNRLFASVEKITVVNTVAERTLLGAGVGNLTIPRNTLSPGRVLRCSAKGFMNTIAVPGGIDFVIYVGLLNGISAGNASPITANLNGASWEVNALLSMTDNPGEIQSNARFEFPTTNAAQSTLSIQSNSELNTIDPMESLVFNLTVAWATADVGNSIICNQFLLELI